MNIYYDTIDIDKFENRILERGLFMSEIDRIIENVNANMTMENMPLFQDDKQRLKECLVGGVSFEEAVEVLVRKYTHSQMSRNT